MTSRSDSPEAGVAPDTATVTHGVPAQGAADPRPAPGRARVQDPVRSLARAVQRVTSTSFGPYQSAVIRIGFAGTWLVFLLRELPHRRELYGPDAPFSWTMAKQLLAGNHAFSALMFSSSGAWFETVYAVAVLSSLLLMLGWRTRAMSVVFMVGVLSLQNRSVFEGDGGDNVIHLMAIYLVFVRCAQVWSLDARRAARRARAERDAAARAAEDAGREPDGGAPLPAAPGEKAPRRTDRTGPVLWVVAGALLVAGAVTGRVHAEAWLTALMWGAWAAQGLWWLTGRYDPEGQPRALLDVVATVLHNTGLAVIMAEVCFVYATAGWYKIQGARWEDGTALYYPLSLHYFSPWPALSAILAHSSLLVLLFSYGTVIVQVAFPFTLFNRRIKNALLVAMILEHLGIAVLLGLPFFSLAMITADAVFLPTNFLLWLGGRAALGRDRLRRRRPAPLGRRPGDGERPLTLDG